MYYVYVIYYIESHVVLKYVDNEGDCLHNFRILTEHCGLKGEIDWRAINLEYVLDDYFPNEEPEQERIHSDLHLSK